MMFIDLGLHSDIIKILFSESLLSDCLNSLHILQDF